MGRLAIAFWFLVCVFSAGCALSVLANLAAGDPAHTVGADVGAFVLFVAVSIGSGVVLFRRTVGGPHRQRVAQRQAAELDREQRVLHAAEQAGGRITLAEIAAHAGLPIDDVEALLAEFERKGTVTSRVSSQGAVVYLFPGLGPAQTQIDDI